MPHRKPMTSPNVPVGDAAQMEQIRQSLARVAENAAEEAAERTVEKLFVGLGFDVSKPEGVLELQETLRFATRMRRAQETIAKQGLKTAVVAIVTGAIAILMLGVKAWFGH